MSLYERGLIFSKDVISHVRGVYCPMLTYNKIEVFSITTSCLDSVIFRVTCHVPVYLSVSV